MVKKIVILERIDLPSARNFRVCFWLEVPATRQPYYAKPDIVDPHTGLTVPGFVSAYRDIDANTLASLKSGQLQEVVIDFRNFKADTTANDMESVLIAKFNELQNNLNNWNPYESYGTYYDSTWHQQGIL